MSYAAVAASGPQQTEEEKRAPAPAEIEHSDEEVHSLVDVDSPHISSVPSDFESQAIQTDTQAREHELEAEAQEKAEQAKKEAEQAKKEAKDKADKLKQEAETKKEQAKKAAEKVADKAKKNSDNPVLLGNAIGIAALGGLLSYGAYRKYSAGDLTWKVAGAWAGVVGLFAVADFYTSQYFFKQYPTKE